MWWRDWYVHLQVCLSLCVGLLVYVPLLVCMYILLYFMCNNEIMAQTHVAEWKEGGPPHRDVKPEDV